MRARHALKRAIDRSDAVAAGFLRPRLQPRLVELNKVDARRLDVAQLRIDGVREGERHLLVVRVEIALACCAIVNGPGSVILVLLRVLARRNAASRTSTGAVRLIGPTTRGTFPTVPVRPDDLGRVVGVDALEHKRETIGVAFPPDLAVGHDVDTGALHIADREDGRVVLCGFEELCLGTRQISGAWMRGTRSTSAPRGPPANPAADSCRRRWWETGR